MKKTRDGKGMEEREGKERGREKEWDGMEREFASLVLGGIDGPVWRGFQLLNFGLQTQQKIIIMPISLRVVLLAKTK